MGLSVAIQGERGSFSHQAAIAMLGQDVELHSCALSSEVFERVSHCEVDAAVIPIENSLAGSVLEHYDLLLQHRLRIEAEFLLRIRHCLIAAPGVSFEDVREVRSHPVALAQCRRFLAAHPRLQALPFYDTAGAVVHAVEAGGTLAGIASEQAAHEYGGVILQLGIEDNPLNYTRFFLLRTAGSPVLGAVPFWDKVSLAFGVPNQPGSLVAALEIFARHRLNLTRLESRPVPGAPWQYVFYADYQLISPDQAESADRALAELRERCSSVQEFGRYRAAEIAM